MAKPRRKKKISLAELRVLLRDPSIDPKSLREFFVVDEAASEAFSPVITYDLNRVDDEGQESALFLNLANGASRRFRHHRYRAKIHANGALRRIVSEGDSWFQYPIMLEDVIDQLFKEDDLAILSLGAAGDLVSDIVRDGEYLEFIEQERAEAFLISGGGNDLLGGGRLSAALRPYDPVLAPTDYIDTDAFRDQLADVTTHFREIFVSLARDFPALRTFCHGYDNVIPKGGRWLGQPMADLGIKKQALQRDIVAAILDRFNKNLEGLSHEFPGQVFYVDCRGAVADDQWKDELHPKNEGFAAVAARLLGVVRAVLPRTPKAARPALTRGREGFLSDPTPMDAVRRRDILARRARLVLDEAVGTITDDIEAARVESEVSVILEKISRGRDFLPARFLSDGHQRAESVCRIQTPDSFGTGFLIATRNFIMTNNHVLDAAAVAAGSVAQFDFEEGDETVTVRLRPERLFITNVRLDFTIVACDDVLGDRVPIPLLRNPATVAAGDRVSIVQHPSGRRKEIAIHDNKVVNDGLEEVVRYSTDTEPGSSGSPVFNNAWNLVALHHAGVGLPDGSAENEGVRMSAIVAHLVRRQRRSGSANESLRLILETVTDSSPMLGFFGVEGVVNDDDREVEIPTFTGHRDFIDVGFWNIEHFNDEVSPARVARVARVLSDLSMDVMGLVEVEENALKRLVDTMRRGHGDLMDYAVLDVRGRQDLAVLYDTATTKVQQASDINKRHRKSLAARTNSGRTAFPREPLFARCTVDQEDNDPIEFIVAVVHLKAFGDPESRARRRLAAEILAEIIEDIRDRETLPVILGGDFNDKLNTDVLSALQSSPDLFALTADDAVSGAVSFVGGRRRSLIDHILVSRDLKLGEISGDDAAIVTLDKTVRNFVDGISDHLPLVMRVVARDSPVEPGDDAAADTNVIAVPDGATRATVSFT